MIGKFFLALWILRWSSYIGVPVVAQKWPVSLDESLDERNDVEIFRAVVESMRQWELHKRIHHRMKREVSKVCYEEVGCFEDTGPFSYLEMLPSPPKDVGTRFLVYGSRKARSIPMEVPAEDINDSAHRAIDPDLPTKVIVHGFGSSCDHVWVYEMRSALMSVHECNLVCVDWGPGSAVPNYVRAAANTRLVGRQLAKLIRSLNVPLEKVHMIGFSLGAHVAGFAGAELGNVSRITGLDPAGPLFESQDPRARLDATDANFVDVIHSNGEQLLLGGLGSWQPMGDVDFYPNGGRMQTGCSNIFVGAVSDIIWSSAVEGRSLCNHRRAYKLFTDSVSPKCRFPAFPCDHGYDGLVKGDCFPCGANDRPCGDMGYYSDKSPGRGQLYLITREEEPFCAHQYQIRVYNSRSERPARSYGKLQVTLVGEGSFNDTFAMTKKDEELLVGSILQKIVVPHPAISNVEAIEIKYTAYSGWISSGLVSWSIDKVAIMDSTGRTLSSCKRGLILESGRPVYLPLYPTDCNIPSEPENSTLSMTTSIDRLIQDKQGIGPFTKEQNYERVETKDNYPFEVFPSERNTAKNVGPFTKDQNIRIEVKDNYKTNKFDESENRRGSSNPWTIVDISTDGDSNSLENLELERGRGFSGNNFIQHSSQSSDRSVESTTEYLPEIKEPVLQLTKKETGRSLKLPEITEPILRPRPARQNLRIEQDKRQDEIQETSSTSSRGFTVQFLPERLAGILAQAERYARQTLLPLISQYTPSFVTGIRQEEPKYFPPLGDTTQDAIQERSMSDGRGSIILDLTQAPNNDDDQRTGDPTTDERFREDDTPEDAPAIVEAIYPEKEKLNSSLEIQGEKFDNPTTGSEWVPIEPVTTIDKKSQVNKPEVNSRRDANVSRSLDWKDLEENPEWSSKVENVNSEMERKIDDWVPITERNSFSTTSKEEIGVSTIVSIEEKNNLDRSKIQESPVNDLSKLEATTGASDNRKFIPLVNLEDNEFSSTSENVLELLTSTVAPATHIQKIPPRSTTLRAIVRVAAKRTMIFPYAYERRKDPRTRYIPLIPEEDFGRSRSTVEKDRDAVS